MRLLPLKLVAVAAFSIWAVGCANASGSDVGTVVGAGTGALAGYAISSDSPVGAVIGAGAGALVGREIGRRHDERVYQRRYYGGY